jgi:hypothetical protein
VKHYAAAAKKWDGVLISTDSHWTEVSKERERQRRHNQNKTQPDSKEGESPAPVSGLDDIVNWLEQLDLDVTATSHGQDHKHDHNCSHTMTAYGIDAHRSAIPHSEVELYRCAWCGNPSASLKKCSACSIARWVIVSFVWSLDLTIATIY